MRRAAVVGLTRRWKVVLIAAASSGFIFGYAATAGQPCGSLGQCLRYATDAGVAGLNESSLISAAVGALLLAGLVFAAFLAFLAIRKPAGRRRAVQAWRGAIAHPTPLQLAVGAAVVWAILSIGPAALARDFGDVIPRDRVSGAPYCPFPSEASAGRCRTEVAPPELFNDGVYTMSDPTCDFLAVLETDGMCHEHSGGTFEPLMNAAVKGGENGLFAFLAVGAALLLWPRLRAVGQQPTN